MNLTVLYALSSAATYGVGDFVAGMASRRNPALRVVALTHPLGLLAYLLLALTTGEAWPGAASLALGAGAGVLGLGAVVLFYRSLALGPMGVVSVTSAALGAVVPVLVGLIGGEALGAGRLSGMGLVLAGIVTFSLVPARGGGGRGGLPLAVLAGAGFGLFFVMLAQAGQGGAFWVLAAARLASSVVALPLAARQYGLRPPSRSWPLLMASAPGDVLGNLFFVLASRAGSLAVAGLLTNLYPLFTTLMAALLLHERLRKTQWAGLLLALAGLSLVTAL